MNIDFLVTKDLFRGGGIETYTREVGQRLAARGHSVTVFSIRGKGTCPERWQGMQIVWLPRIAPHWVEKPGGAVFATWTVMRRDPPDVIHLHSVAAGCLASILRRKKVPCVVQMHGIEWMRTRWGLAARTVLKTMERMSVASATALTAVSQTQCDYYKQFYGACCEYIPTAADIKEAAAADLICRLGLRRHQYILFAARLVPEKGAHHLIRAFKRLQTNCSLVIAGEAPAQTAYTKELRELAASDPRISFVGHVAGRLLAELFSNAAVFVQPSELEGLSIGLIEAMSYGLCCIASNIPENQEVIGDAGFLFESKNVDDLEKTLNWALQHVEYGSEVGAKAQGRVRSAFCWDRVVDQLEDLYDRVTRGAQAPVAKPQLVQPLASSTER